MKQQIPLHDHNLEKASTVTEMTLTALFCFLLKRTCSYSQISLPQVFRTSTALCYLKGESQKPKIVYVINMLHSLSCNWWEMLSGLQPCSILTNFFKLLHMKCVCAHMLVCVCTCTSVCIYNCWK